MSQNVVQKTERKEIMGLNRMTKKGIKDLCKKDKGYQTPSLNDVLYLHYKGFECIECLEEYTELKCLWLECNAISEIQGLENQAKLKCLFLQNNLIKRIENLDHCKELDTLNVASNHIRKVENCGVDVLPMLNTLNLSSNYLRDYEALEQLEHCKHLSVLDLANNRIDDILVVKVFAKMPNLRVLVLQGNPVVSRLPQYRKTLILECKELTYLDSRPVFPKDRACAEAWKRGGYEEERKENERWNRKERRKIRDSVNSTIRLRNKYRPADQQEPIFNSSDSEEDAAEEKRRKRQSEADAGVGLELGTWDEVNESKSESSSELNVSSSTSVLSSTDSNTQDSSAEILNNTNQKSHKHISDKQILDIAEGGDGDGMPSLLKINDEDLKDKKRNKELGDQKSRRILIEDITGDSAVTNKESNSGNELLEIYSQKSTNVVVTNDEDTKKLNEELGDQNQKSRRILIEDITAGSGVAKKESISSNENGGLLEIEEKSNKLVEELDSNVEPSSSKLLITEMEPESSNLNVRSTLVEDIKSDSSDSNTDNSSSQGIPATSSNLLEIGSKEDTLLIKEIGADTSHFKAFEKDSTGMETKCLIEEIATDSTDFISSNLDLSSAETNMESKFLIKEIGPSSDFKNLVTPEQGLENSNMLDVGINRESKLIIQEIGADSSEFQAFNIVDDGADKIGIKTKLIEEIDDSSSFGDSNVEDNSSRGIEMLDTKEQVAENSNILEVCKGVHEESKLHIKDFSDSQVFNINTEDSEKIIQSKILIEEILPDSSEPNESHQASQFLVSESDSYLNLYEQASCSHHSKRLIVDTPEDTEQPHTKISRKSPPINSSDEEDTKDVYNAAVNAICKATMNDLSSPRQSPRKRRRIYIDPSNVEETDDNYDVELEIQAMEEKLQQDLNESTSVIKSLDVPEPRYRQQTAREKQEEQEIQKVNDKVEKDLEEMENTVNSFLLELMHDQEKRGSFEPNYKNKNPYDSSPTSLTDEDEETQVQLPNKMKRIKQEMEKNFEADMAKIQARYKENKVEVDTLEGDDNEELCPLEDLCKLVEESEALREDGLTAEKTPRKRVSFEDLMKRGNQQKREKMEHDVLDKNLEAEESYLEQKSLKDKETVQSSYEEDTHLPESNECINSQDDGKVEESEALREDGLTAEKTPGKRVSFEDLMKRGDKQKREEMEHDVLEKNLDDKQNNKISEESSLEMVQRISEEDTDLEKTKNLPESNEHINFKDTGKDDVELGKLKDLESKENINSEYTEKLIQKKDSDKETISFTEDMELDTEKMVQIKNSKSLTKEPHSSKHPEESYKLKKISEESEKDIDEKELEILQETESTPANALEGLNLESSVSSKVEASTIEDLEVPKQNVALTEFEKETEELKKLLQKLEDENERLFAINATYREILATDIHEEIKYSNETSCEGVEKLCESILDELIEQLNLIKPKPKSYEFEDFHSDEEYSYSDPPKPAEEPVACIRDVIGSFNVFIKDVARKNREAEEEKQRQLESVTLEDDAEQPAEEPAKKFETTEAEKAESLQNLIKSHMVKQFSEDTAESLDAQIEEMKKKRKKQVKRLIDKVYAQKDKYDDTLDVVDGKLVIIKKDSGEIEEVNKPKAWHDDDTDTDDYDTAESELDEQQEEEAAKKEAGLKWENVIKPESLRNMQERMKAVIEQNKNKESEQEEDEYYSLEPTQASSTSIFGNIDEEFFDKLDFSQLKAEAANDPHLVECARSYEELRKFMKLSKEQQNLTPSEHDLFKQIMERTEKELQESSTNEKENELLKRMVERTTEKAKKDVNLANIDVKVEQIKHSSLVQQVVKIFEYSGSWEQQEGEEENAEQTLKEETEDSEEHIAEETLTETEQSEQKIAKEVNQSNSTESPSLEIFESLPVALEEIELKVSEDKSQENEDNLTEENLEERKITEKLQYINQKQAESLEDGPSIRYTVNEDWENLAKEEYKELEQMEKNQREHFKSERVLHKEIESESSVEKDMKHQTDLMMCVEECNIGDGHAKTASNVTSPSNKELAGAYSLLSTETEPKPQLLTNTTNILSSSSGQTQHVCEETQTSIPPEEKPTDVEVLECNLQVFGVQNQLIDKITVNAEVVYDM